MHVAYIPLCFQRENREMRYLQSIWRLTNAIDDLRSLWSKEDNKACMSLSVEEFISLSGPKKQVQTYNKPGVHIIQDMLDSTSAALTFKYALYKCSKHLFVLLGVFYCSCLKIFLISNRYNK